MESVADKSIHSERTTLVRMIQTVEQVAEMSTEELQQLANRHERERLILAGQLQTSSDMVWSSKARHALRCLHVHHGWISRELAKRKKSDVDNKLLKLKSAESALAAARSKNVVLEAKIQKLNHFARLVREHVGVAEYNSLWERAHGQTVKLPLVVAQEAEVVAVGAVGQSLRKALNLSSATAIDPGA